MLQIQEDRDRNVVPRWRTLADALAFREVLPVSIRSARPHIQASPSLDALVTEYNLTKSISVGCDAISTGIAATRFDSVREIASALLNTPQTPILARQLAIRFCSEDANSPDDFFLTQYGKAELSQLRNLVRDARLRLARVPRNPLLWTNLALMYTIQGQNFKAARALKVARAMAPDDRFVLRASSRFALHQGDLDEAHSYLRNARSIKSDPWILASELAMAAVCHRQSSNFKRARLVLDRDMLPPFHLSELAAALATEETRNGSIRRARQVCDKALREPAENAVAQASWLHRNHDLPIRPLNSHSMQSNEAEAWKERTFGHWDNALRLALLWQNDQPFSSRPAVVAANICTIIKQDYPQAESILYRALLSNASDATIINNLAFALAKQDKLTKAAALIAHVDFNSVSTVQRICLTATKGLIAFREGHLNVGRDHYHEAIRAAQASSLPSLGVTALFNLTIEQLQGGDEDAVGVASQLPPLIDKFIPVHDATAMRTQLTQSIDLFRGSAADGRST